MFSRLCTHNTEISLQEDKKFGLDKQLTRFRVPGAVSLFSVGAFFSFSTYHRHFEK